MMRCSFVPIWLTLLLLLSAIVSADAPKVYVISIHGAVWPSTAIWVRQQLDMAYRQGASGVILDVDTTEGASGAADEIKQAILAHAGSYPIAAYVHDKALGPGSLIPIACKTLAIAPGGSLGAADANQSKATFQAAAEASGRNPGIASAFILADSALPSLGIKPGDSLTLTAQQAQSVGYADVIAADYPAVLAKMSPSLAGAQLVPVELSAWEAVALWVSQPWATVLLLALGLALVVIEMLTFHSWGIAGIFGGLLVALIFAAHIAVGTATWVGVVLFLAGIALLLFETHVFPGHGLSALAGLILIFIGIYYAIGGAQAGALYSALSALFVTMGIVTAFFIYLPRSGVWKRLGQPMRQTASTGYVSSDDYTGFVGQSGIAVTLLRPSGIAEIAGFRLPVVTEGEFIAQGTPIEVVLVQGSRVVVRPVETLAVDPRP